MQLKHQHPSFVGTFSKISGRSVTLVKVYANVNNKFPKKFQSVEAPTAKTLLR